MTLAHLMAHTAGFEDRSVGLFARTPASVRPLAELLGNGLPERVHPVGEVAAYSNHGAALAGLVVEEVSGLAWNDYLEERILAPEGMTRTTGEQPVPVALEADLAIGYDVVGGSFAPRTFDYAPLAPAGSMSATGDDLARFVLVHLQGGTHDGGRILRSETVEAMHRTHTTQDPRLSGSAHGFIEQVFEGRRTIGQGGGIVADFFAHRYRSDGVAVAEPASLEAHRPDVVGTYRPTRVAHTTLDKLAGLLQAATIASAGDGTRVATNLGTFGTTRWSPVEPLVYREAGGRRDLLVFQEDGEGRIGRALLGSLPHVAFDPNWSAASRTSSSVLPAVRGRIVRLDRAGRSGRKRSRWSRPLPYGCRTRARPPPRGWPGVRRGASWDFEQNRLEAGGVVERAVVDGRAVAALVEVHGDLHGAGARRGAVAGREADVVHAAVAFTVAFGADLEVVAEADDGVARLGQAA